MTNIGLSSVVRLIERAVSVYRDFGVMGVASRASHRLLQLFGREDPEHTEWLRRQQLADAEFDALYGTNTGGVQHLHGMQIVGDNGRHAVAHIASDPTAFMDVIRKLQIDPAACTFVDLGSGKGRVLLMAAASFPFRRVIGVEFASELHEAARANVALFSSKRPEAAPIDLVCGDAAAYQLPDEPLVIYLFNPFGSAIVRRVAESIRASCLASPRPVYVVYMNPVHLADFTAAGWQVSLTGIGVVCLTCAAPGVVRAAASAAE